MGEMRNTYKVFVGNLKGDLRVEGRVILKWTLKKQPGKLWTGLICLRIYARTGSGLL
jgi:hypothetical protein